MKNRFLLCLLFFPMTVFSNPIRLKELVHVKGVRGNPIIGYGLVIGLNGTGDSGSEIVENSMKVMLKKMGISPKNEIDSKNVASVIVTAKLPPFGRVGQKVDATVSSIGNASSLAGGNLLITPLKGGDDQVYAIASGNISIGGLEKGKKFPTTGIVSGGVIIEKENPVAFHKKKSIRLGLKNPDFTTSARIEKVINQELGGKYATSKDATTVDLIVPIYYKRKVVQLLAIIENFKVNTDNAAKIIINERTGTIMTGGNVFLKPVAIAHGDLAIEITRGEKSNKKEKSNQMYFMDQKTTLNDLVKGLNAFGVTPEDLIAIFQALKKSGSLIGEIEFI